MEAVRVGVGTVLGRFLVDQATHPAGRVRAGQEWDLRMQLAVGSFTVVVGKLAAEEAACARDRGVIGAAS